MIAAIARGLCAVIGLVGMSLAVGVFAAGAGEAQHACPSVGVVVVKGDANDSGDICAGALAASRFLEGFGLVFTRPLVVQVTTRFPREVDATAAGCFIEREGRAFILPYAAFNPQGTWLGVPIDREMYRALAGHEVAHAIAACNFAIPRPSIQAKEYIAYVAMFAGMSERKRSAVLRALPGTGFENIDRVSSFVYLADPMRFGADAYRHFTLLQDQAAFLRAVLKGEVFVE